MSTAQTTGGPDPQKPSLEQRGPRVLTLHYKLPHILKRRSNVYFPCPSGNSERTFVTAVTPSSLTDLEKFRSYTQDQHLSHASSSRSTRSSGVNLGDEDGFMAMKGDDSLMELEDTPAFTSHLVRELEESFKDMEMPTNGTKYKVEIVQNSNEATTLPQAAEKSGTSNNATTLSLAAEKLGTWIRESMKGRSNAAASGDEVSTGARPPSDRETAAVSDREFAVVSGLSESGTEYMACYLEPLHRSAISKAVEKLLQQQKEEQGGKKTMSGEEELGEEETCWL